MPIRVSKYCIWFGSANRWLFQDVVHEWCKGASFSQICKMTDVFEGEFTQKFVFSVSVLNGYIIIRNIVSRKYHSLHASS